MNRIWRIKLVNRVVRMRFEIERALAGFVDRCSQSLLRVSLGVIYLVFGLLKVFPKVSPAEELACQTIEILTFHVIGGRVALCTLAALEAAIGLMLILRYRLRISIPLALGHMVCTFTPMILMPNEMIPGETFGLSLVGQYLLKNLVLVSALLVVYSQVSNTKFKQV